MRSLPLLLALGVSALASADSPPLAALAPDQTAMLEALTAALHAVNRAPALVTKGMVVSIIEARGEIIVSFHNIKPGPGGRVDVTYDPARRRVVRLVAED